MVHSYLVMKNKPLYSAFTFLNPLTLGFSVTTLPNFVLALLRTDSPANDFSPQFRYIRSLTLATGQTL